MIWPLPVETPSLSPVVWLKNSRLLFMDGWMDYKPLVSSNQDMMRKWASKLYPECFFFSYIKSRAFYVQSATLETNFDLWYWAMYITLTWQSYLTATVSQVLMQVVQPACLSKIVSAYDLVTLCRVLRGHTIRLHNNIMPKMSHHHGTQRLSFL